MGSEQHNLLCVGIVFDGVSPMRHTRHVVVIRGLVEWSGSGRDKVEQHSLTYTKAVFAVHMSVDVPYLSTHATDFECTCCGASFEEARDVDLDVRYDMLVAFSYIPGRSFGDGACDDQIGVTHHRCLRQLHDDRGVRLCAREQ